MLNPDHRDLNLEVRAIIYKAVEVRNHAYCPYSNHAVGAALVDEHGQFHTGCNVEIADYTMSSHAEMVAIDSMIKSGARIIKAVAIAIIDDGDIHAPCGLCRQKISEFVDSNIEIYSVNLNSDQTIKGIHQFTINELYPHPFHPSNNNK